MANAAASKGMAGANAVVVLIMSELKVPPIQGAAPMFLPRNSVGAGSVGKPGSAPAGRVGLVRDHLHPGAEDTHAESLS